MPLQWNVSDEKYFYDGISQPVLWVHDVTLNANNQNLIGSNGLVGVPWEGLTSVEEKPTGGDISDHYANDVVYARTSSAEQFEGTIQAFNWPLVFHQALGINSPHPGFMIYQQMPKYFSLAYKTRVHRDSGLNHDEKIVLLYNLRVKPYDINNKTLDESPEPNTYSWDFVSTKFYGLEFYVGLEDVKPFNKLEFMKSEASWAAHDSIFENGFLMRPSTALII